MDLSILIRETSFYITWWLTERSTTGQGQGVPMEGSALKENPIAPLHPTRLSDHCRRRGRKTLRARDGGWLHQNSVFKLQLFFFQLLGALFHTCVNLTVSSWPSGPAVLSLSSLLAQHLLSSKRVKDNDLLPDSFGICTFPMYYSP